MVSRDGDPPDDVVRGVRSLSALRRLEQECRRCELYLPATQVVPGRGRGGAPLMLVGEQPGDREDLAGEPFVGPAGRVLADALEQAGIDPDRVFLTNAVKHFRFEPRGKRRLHKKPSVAHVTACNAWLHRELALVKPRVVVALGATAARALSGRPMAVGATRGRPIALEQGPTLWVTVHPSALLRLRDRAARDAAFAAFVSDLRAAAT